MNPRLRAEAYDAVVQPRQFTHMAPPLQIGYFIQITGTESTMAVPNDPWSAESASHPRQCPFHPRCP